ncbi:OmpA family protein [Methylobacterium iners]|jgi:outer membrane protein OmpA-like peptidoglycan-associated protein|uniref:Peptidoglycan-associated lipoprotein n=1 Tax=Methylobacterium iners TaxID=418707 RepID=A0ABQ4S2P8_9HYPH|nr:OmpA family protein [Methylobacterium iners]GJD97359.1 Peptidoglycan-associated lipoprotein [Methylobacterium iners]
MRSAALLLAFLAGVSGGVPVFAQDAPADPPEPDLRNLPKLRSSVLSFRVSPFTFRTSVFGFRTSGLVFRTTLLRTETAGQIEVVLPADVLFDFDKAEIRSAAADALRELAEIIRKQARGPITIQGYTDAKGGEAYNQKLSERRAAAVKTWLAKREGIAPGSLATQGFGARNPVAPNAKPDGADDPEGRQLNRRVTIIIRK